MSIDRMVAVILLALIALSATGESQPSTRPATANEARREKLKAARDVVRSLDAREAQGEPLTPSFVQMQADWSRRVFYAETDVAAGKDEKVAAAKAWIARAKRLDNLLIKQSAQDVTRMQIALAHYEIADAELALAKLNEP